MMNWLKKLIILKLLILVIQLKNDYDAKIIELHNKIATDHDHDKHDNSKEFNKLTSGSFAATLAQKIQQVKMILLIYQKRQILMIN